MITKFPPVPPEQCHCGGRAGYSNKEDALLIAYPGYLSGSIAVSADNELWGSETLLRLAFADSDSFHLHGLLGYRFAYLRDSLRINQTSEWLVDDGFIYAGTGKRIFDQFASRNEFHGGTLGLAVQLRRPRWFLDLTGKVSLGSTGSTVWIDGATTTTVPGADPMTTGGGLLALGTNIGEHKLSSFSVIPEASLTLGYNVTPRLQLSAGYTFIYWSGVVRPGDQIDLSVNPSQFPPGPLVGPARPEFPARSTGFWAQGLNLGIEYRF